MSFVNSNHHSFQPVIAVQKVTFRPGQKFNLDGILNTSLFDILMKFKIEFRVIDLVIYPEFKE